VPKEGVRRRNGAAADHVAHLEITAASRSETCEWLPPRGAAGSVRIAPAVLNEMQFSSFDVVQITIDIYINKPPAAGSASRVSGSDIDALKPNVSKTCKESETP
jgi:hypothetical protein